jgi:hypothetical protein
MALLGARIEDEDRLLRLGLFHRAGLGVNHRG